MTHETWSGHKLGFPLYCDSYGNRLSRPGFRFAHTVETFCIGLARESRKIILRSESLNNFNNFDLSGQVGCIIHFVGALIHIAGMRKLATCYSRASALCRVSSAGEYWLYFALCHDGRMCASKPALAFADPSTRVWMVHSQSAFAITDSRSIIGIYDLQT
jgi:hypothetical protein